MESLFFANIDNYSIVKNFLALMQSSKILYISFIVISFLIIVKILSIIKNITSKIILFIIYLFILSKYNIVAPDIPILKEILNFTNTIFDFILNTLKGPLSTNFETLFKLIKK